MEHREKEIVWDAATSIALVAQIFLDTFLVTYSKHSKNRMKTYSKYNEFNNNKDFTKSCKISIFRAKFFFFPFRNNLNNKLNKYKKCTGKIRKTMTLFVFLQFIKHSCNLSGSTLQSFN